MTDPGPPTRAAAHRPPWSEFRSALDRLGFRPTKTLGQNFLVDPNAARSIAADAAVGEGARVLEVGAGCGFLTLHLAELGVELLSIEIDARLFAVARSLLSGWSNVRLLLGDALAGKHALAPTLSAALPASGPWHVVSNLPYSISAPLLAVLARLPNPPASLTVLVQEEVAERIAARPGEAAWGALSARLSLLYRARLGRMVGAQLFWPRPRVGSRVAHLELAPIALLEEGDLAAFDALVDVLFQQRRKQLAGVLATHLGGRGPTEALLRATGVDPRGRAEELDPAALLALSRAPGWRSGRGTGA